MDNGTNGNWLSEDGEQLNNSDPFSFTRPTIEEVDLLADELVVEHDNPDYRKWYCDLIWDFGVERVRYWQQKALGGNSPGKLFTYYARQAQTQIPKHQRRSRVVASAATKLAQPTPPLVSPPEAAVEEPVAIQNATSERHGYPGVLDTVYYPSDQDLTPEGIERSMTESMLKYGMEDPRPQRVDPWENS